MSLATKLETLKLHSNVSSAKISGKIENISTKNFKFELLFCCLLKPETVFVTDGFDISMNGVTGVERVAARTGAQDLF